jgi:hypothetical protein
MEEENVFPLRILIGPGRGFFLSLYQSKYPLRTSEIMFLSPNMSGSMTLKWFHHASVTQQTFRPTSSHPSYGQLTAHSASSHHCHTSINNSWSTGKCWNTNDWQDSCKITAYKWGRGQGELACDLSIAHMCLYLQSTNGKKNNFHFAYSSFSLSLLNCGCYITQCRLRTKIPVLASYLYIRVGHS